MNPLQLASAEIRACARSLRTWRAAITMARVADERLAACTATVARAARRLAWRRVALSWERWANVEQRQRGAHQRTLVRVMLTRVSRLCEARLADALRAWRAAAQNAERATRVVRRVAARITRANVARAFGKWRELVRELVHLDASASSELRSSVAQVGENTDRIDCVMQGERWCRRRPLLHNKSRTASLQRKDAPRRG